MMAADGDRRDARAGSKQEQRSSQSSHHGAHRDVFRDCIGSIIQSLSEFGAKVCARALKQGWEIGIVSQSLRAHNSCNVSIIKPLSSIFKVTRSPMS